MARDEFFQSVRAAVRFAAPTVDVDNLYTDTKALRKALRATTRWLNPGSVKGFRPEDYKDLPPEQQQELTSAVGAFLEVAEAMRPLPLAGAFDALLDYYRETAPGAAAMFPPTVALPQVRAALPPFLKIVKIVQGLIRDEWLGAVTRLVGDAEAWSTSRDWATKRDDKEIAEDFLGTYKAPRLLIAKDASRLLLEPVARFIPAGTGLVDFAVLPSYDSVMISRTNGGWYVHPDHGNKPRPWSEAVFQDLANRLSKRG